MQDPEGDIVGARAFIVGSYLHRSAEDLEHLCEYGVRLLFGVSGDLRLSVALPTNEVDVDVVAIALFVLP